jgi:hypothetical protein
MTRTAYYNNLVNHIPPGLYQDVFRLLASTTKDRRITRQGLIMATHAEDRQLRDVIADLVTQYRIPILSESGKPGYWLAETEAEKQESIAELLSRAEQLTERAKALRKAEIPAAADLRRAQAEVQATLW